MSGDTAFQEQITPTYQNEFRRLLDEQRSAFRANPMPSLEERRECLVKLRRLLPSEQQSIIDAISADFSNRSADETLLAELMPSTHGIRYAGKHLKKGEAREAPGGSCLSAGQGESHLSAARGGWHYRPLELPAVARGWPPAMIYPPYGKTLQKMVYKLFIR